MADFTALIKAELDLSNITQQLKSIQSSQIKFSNIQIDGAEIRKQVQAAFDGIKIDVGTSGKNAQGVTKPFNELLQIAQKISKTEIKLKGLGDSGSASQLAHYSRELDGLWSKFKEVQSSMESGFTIGQSNQLNTVFSNVESELQALDAKFSDAKQKMADGIQFKLDTGQFTHAVDEVKSKFDTLQNAPAYVAKNMATLNSAFDVLQSKDTGIDAKIRAMQQYNAILPVVKSQIADVARAESDLTQKNAQILSNNITTWMNQNGKAADAFKDRLNELQTRLQNVKSPAELKQIATDFKLIQSEAKSLGMVVSNIGSAIGRSVKQMLGITTGAMALRKAVQIGKQMYEEVKAVDSAMVELKKVTDETAAAYNKFQSNVGKNAQKIGTTMSDLINSTADFGRLGYQLSEAEGLAQVANIYSVVGDEIDGIDEATKSLISTMQAFRGEMSATQTQEDFALNIVDKFNEVGKVCCPAA